jgi:hypothetical protein
MSARDLWNRSLGRGAQWRYFVLVVVAMLLPTALAFMPIASFLRSLLDHSPRSGDLVARLDSPAFIEVLRQLGEPAGAAIGPGLLEALLLASVVAPGLAGATAALAREPESPLRLRSLLGGAGELYPRMLRMALVACVPLGVAGAGAAGAFHMAHRWSERGVLESTADHATQLAIGVSVLLVWLAHVTIEAGRAHLAAQPERKSAFLAWWSGVRLTLRHARRVLGLCLVTTLLGVGGALLVTALRYRIAQGGPVTIALAFVLGQLAIVAIAWGRSSRMVGLVDLVRAESGDGPAA